MPGFLGSSHLFGVWRSASILMAQASILTSSRDTRRPTQTDRGSSGSQSQLALNLEYGER